MNYDMEQTEFTKSLLAGVFAGITATVLSLLYNIIFRGYTGFYLSMLINVTTVIFAVLLLCAVSGFIFYFFHHFLKNGTVLFQLISLVITVLLILAGLQVQRSADAVVSKEFRELLTGITLITGACICAGIPFLYRHDYI